MLSWNCSRYKCCLDKRFGQTKNSLECGLDLCSNNRSIAFLKVSRKISLRSSITVILFICLFVVVFIVVVFGCSEFKSCNYLILFSVYSRMYKTLQKLFGFLISVYYSLVCWTVRNINTSHQMSLLYKYTHHWEIWLISSDFYAFALRHVWQPIEKLLTFFCIGPLIKVYFPLYNQHIIRSRSC